ncbi:hypothetical protein BUALT_Bualt02G0071000 [Buddleja alternifolia]|uniref:PRISE-like Rossmann-fold domain-containing protein n=1 Tax=Buddleja alternifolia TaxID=168488 RepID=A0AAV6Y996_9LAMI|nr:hypothetical protein BUALT_Bualt02G0071000 [Buddleja alternifolia]
MDVSDTKNSFVGVVFGVSGLVGKELARKLVSTCKWKKVYGIARRPDLTSISGIHFISCDLLNPLETKQKLSSVLEETTHIFWVTWANQFPLDTEECFQQNKTMMSNVLNALLPTSKSLKHVSLQTGTKHYVSLQGQGQIGQLGYYDEHSPRVTKGNNFNFYYGLEDLLQERLSSSKVSWSIHRPGLITGCSDRTLYNFIGSLCVYGTICKYMNLPFVFGGTEQCWEETFIDLSDARLVAEQHIWAATNTVSQVQGQGEAFNAINGENYVWKEIWRAISYKFGVNVSESSMFCVDFTFSSAMADKGGVWKEIVMKEGLQETKMEDLANWDFLDVLFRCPIKMLGTRTKADRMGFKTRYNALDSIFYWIDVMKAERFIP